MPNHDGTQAAAPQPRPARSERDASEHEAWHAAIAATGTLVTRQAGR